MQKFLLLLICILALQSTFAQNVGINATGATPDISAGLDVDLTNKGLLIPRIALVSTTDAATILTPATSLLVYNTNLAITGGQGLGYYYNSGTTASPLWIKLATSNEAWLVNGNSNTAVGTNFLGTRNLTGLRFNTNNQERMRVDSVGRIRIGAFQNGEINSNYLYTQTKFTMNTLIDDAISFHGAGNLYEPNYFFDRSYGTVTTPTAFNADIEAVANFWFNRYDGTAWRTSGLIDVTNDGTASATSSPGRMTFFTSPAGQNAGVAEVMRLDNQNRVGVGLPSATQIGSSYNAAKVEIGMNSTGNDGVVFRGASSSNFPPLLFFDKVGGTLTAPTAHTTIGNLLGRIHFRNSYNGIAYSSAAYIDAQLDATATVTASPGRLRFVTQTAAGTLLERMRVSSNGTVGINTLALLARLEVLENTGLIGARIRSNTGTADGLQVLHTGTGNGIYVNAAGANNWALVASNQGYLPTLDFIASGWSVNTTTRGAITAGGENTGIEASAEANGNGEDKLPGSFYSQNSSSFPSFATVGAIVDGTTYKILGIGAVSTLVKDADDKERIMAAPEAPEVLFQDFGTAKLINGKAHIDIDPILVKNIFVDENHPIKVFVQIEGDCNGVFVTNKTQNGFDVVELQNGTSNITFSWMLTANRADETRGNQTSHYSSMRFKPLNREFKYDANKLSIYKNTNQNNVDVESSAPKVEEQEIKDSTPTTIGISKTFLNRKK